MLFRCNITLYVLLAINALALVGCSNSTNEQQGGLGVLAAPGKATPSDLPAIIVASEHRVKYTVERNSCVYNVLLKAGFTSHEIQQIVTASEDVYPLASVKAGTTFELRWENADSQNSTAHFLTAQLSPVSRLEITRIADGSWQANLIEIPFQTRLMSFTGVVKSSLWGSASVDGMDPQLIGELAAIFAWQVDFNREVRTGDHWRILVEQKHVGGIPYEWGNILAAEYVNRGTTYTGIRFAADGEHGSYFDRDGKSLRKMFLKAPLKFSRITSYFKAQRFHPVLKIMRPHLGVDYGAPTGTPIMSVGSGRIAFAGWAGDSGYMVKVRHNSVYSTAYLHMKNIASHIKPGVSVEQGQVIGFVGMTGLATGPHCHFAFYENNRYVDPLSMKFPAADPVPSESIQAFNAVKTEMLQKLPEFTPVQMVSVTAAVNNKANWN